MQAAGSGGANAASCGAGHDVRAALRVARGGGEWPRRAGELWAFVAADCLGRSRGSARQQAAGGSSAHCAATDAARSPGRRPWTE